MKRAFNEYSIGAVLFSVQIHVLTHTHTHTYLYIPSNVDPPFFFRNQFFLPLTEDTHTRNINMVIMDLTDTHGLVCDMVLSNRGPPYPYYTP